MSMQSTIELSESVKKSLRCPICRARIEKVMEEYVCENLQCYTRFPIVHGVPILINERNSIFFIEGYTSGHNSTIIKQSSKGFKSLFKWVIPNIGIDLKAEKNFIKFSELLLAKSKTPKVLIVGSGIFGQGMEFLLSIPSIDIIESDVSLSSRTMLICDAHDLPFEDGAFDAVIVQAVLEHVVNPYRCVEEIHRVLNKNGLVYSDTPFMQQGHMGPYDFTRFTHLGHRRLFRMFQEIDSGVACGPGMALAWSYRYFLWSFTKSPTLRKIILVFSAITSFFLKYFDVYLIDKAGAYDAASSFYFIGKKSDKAITDRELISLYKGAQ